MALKWQLNITTDDNLRERMERIVGACVRGGMKDEAILNLFEGLQKLVDAAKKTAAEGESA